jgi:hypothetical protein
MLHAGPSVKFAVGPFHAFLKVATIRIEVPTPLRLINCVLNVVGLFGAGRIRHDLSNWLNSLSDNALKDQLEKPQNEIGSEA